MPTRRKYTRARACVRKGGKWQKRRAPQKAKIGTRRAAGEEGEAPAAAARKSGRERERAIVRAVPTLHGGSGVGTHRWKHKATTI